MRDRDAIIDRILVWGVLGILYTAVCAAWIASW